MNQEKSFEFHKLNWAKCCICDVLVDEFHIEHMNRCVFNIMLKNIYEPITNINPIIIEYYVFLYIFSYISIPINELSQNLSEDNEIAVKFAKKIYKTLYDYRINKEEECVNWSVQNSFVFAALITIKNKRDCFLQIWPGFTKDVFESMIPNFQAHLIYSRVNKCIE